jgi:hypothetical protein
MRTACLILITLCCTLVASARQDRMIRSTQKDISFTINGRYGSWTIMPEVKPDRLEVACEWKKNKVKFITDIDSISFTIREGDTVQFYIRLNDTALALTEIVGIRPNARFSSSYIKQRKGNTEIAIPEVHELANIVVALTDIGMADSNMVAMTTPYYAEVMRHFRPYKDHVLIGSINKQLQPLESIEGYWFYYALKMNSCSWKFDEDGKLTRRLDIMEMGFGHPGNPVPGYKEMLEDFAIKSGFRKFYSDHKAHYDTLLQVYRTYNNLGKMQHWAEQFFNKKYGTYTVYFSPLVGGAHSTQRYNYRGFTETVMFVDATYEYKKHNPAVNEMLSSRVVFTEIDHNFVNPVSSRYRKDINEAFSSRTKWVDTSLFGTGGYSNPEAVFNEYMTWAVYSLYCIDHFKPADRDLFIPMMEQQMANMRGFIKFKEFNRQLMQVYIDKPGIKPDELFSQMLAWSKKV